MRQIESELRDNPRVQELCRALQACAEEDELMLSFLRDLLTPREIEDAANRWAAAIRLSQGGSIRKTASDLNMAPVIVGRVRQWLENGTGGYKRIIDQLPSSGVA